MKPVLRLTDSKLLCHFIGIKKTDNFFTTCLLPYNKRKVKLLIFCICLYLRNLKAIAYVNFKRNPLFLKNDVIGEIIERR